MQLSETIIQKIHDEGPISFHDYMEMCLYDPRAGYYTSPNDNIGIKGDFYTISSVTAVFGAMLGRQIEEMWELMGHGEFSIVEYGAGTGVLCHDVLDHLEYNAELYRNLRYYIIEKSPAMREKEKTHLSNRVQWVDSIGDIEPIRGCVISNELVDNFSVHRVVMKKELMEVFVDHRDGFNELLVPASKELTDYLKELDVVLPEEFHAEINLEAVEWIREIANQLRQGWVLTADYGFTSSELYKSRRSKGTVMCYHKHTINDQPYINIGKQDITTHINFSALSHWGRKAGLDTCGLIQQAGFLTALGYDDYLTQVLLQKDDKYSSFQQYAFLKRLLLMDMGQKFKILIQSKGIKDKKLKCFDSGARNIDYSAM